MSKRKFASFKWSAIFFFLLFGVGIAVGRQTLYRIWGGEEQQELITFFLVVCVLLQ
jgi:hypothetical protein